MKLCTVLKERIDGGIGGASTSYLGKLPSLASVYNWGYKGYYQGGEEDPVAELSQDAENQLIDQAIDLMYSCLLYTSPSPRDRTRSRMPSSA